LGNDIAFGKDMALIQETVELPHIHLPHPHLHHPHRHHCGPSGSPEDPGNRQSKNQDEITPSVDALFPPADHGINARLFLASAFVLEAMVWGFAFTYGIFQDYYLEHHLFRKHENSLATVGTAQSGIMYIGMLPMFYTLLRFP
jgi:hypothetical protein